MPREIIKQDMLVPLKVWMDLDTPGDWQVVEQMQRVSALPWVFNHTALMADGHVGIGCAVGAVVALRQAISPAVTGVDIGCGMGAIQTSLFNGDLTRKKIEQVYDLLVDRIPVGFNGHGAALAGVRDHPLMQRFDTLVDEVNDLKSKATSQVGTLGSGNHFIELCTSDTGHVWMMLHSGSRNIGKEIAEHHIKAAKGLEHNRHLPDRNLSVFLEGSPEMDQYWNDLQWAQEYAFLNRSMMFELYKNIIDEVFTNVGFADPILCHHNYVAKEKHFGEEVYVTRKGAISAREGDYGIIPGAMGRKSFIVRGLGNPESFASASHGAGRRLSRGAAKRKYTEADVERSTHGVKCRTDRGIVDEIAEAYKDIEQVMKNQADLVEPVVELQGVLCVKG